ncbi:DUF4158 domain-containing protein [Streptomyces sp. NPDC001586]|uniref:DUF4158 domain-containing protein n=1 Tax=Streptomyces sp. NPDC001586 TaxID=3154387 RepID=UPI00331848A8
MTRTPLDLDELVEHWTLLKDEQVLVSGKRGATRLGFDVLLKFYTEHGRFPRDRAELPGEAVEFVARQVQVPASELGFYELTGRTVEYHRAQIRGHLGFRECSVVDAEKLTAAGWAELLVYHQPYGLSRRCPAVQGPAPPETFPLKEGAGDVGCRARLWRDRAPNGRYARPVDIA